MTTEKKTTKCFIAAFNNPNIDPVLEINGFSKGMICFSIPSLGILFRCRSEGSLIDLEFGALFALLKFVTTKLKEEKIKSVQVFSSNPEFVFSFTSHAATVKKDSARGQLLAEFARQIKLAIGYAQPAQNKALTSAADYPSVPVDKSVHLDFDPSELSKLEFKPLQKGIKL